MVLLAVLSTLILVYAAYSEFKSYIKSCDEIFEHTVLEVIEFSIPIITIWLGVFGNQNLPMCILSTLLLIIAFIGEFMVYCKSTHDEFQTVIHVCQDSIFFIIPTLTMWLIYAN